MSYADALGTWNELATVQPIFDDWLDVYLTSFYSQTFRLIFTSTDWSKKANTWLWIRHKWPTADRSLSVRIYPRETPLIISLPIPQEFVQAGMVVTDLEVKKGGYFRLGITPHVPWSVTIHEKIS